MSPSRDSAAACLGTTYVSCKYRQTTVNIMDCNPLARMRVVNPRPNSPCHRGCMEKLVARGGGGGNIINYTRAPNTTKDIYDTYSAAQRKG